ncbi:MAG: hypothetical protein R3C19_16160 [Planctomycetaceae bacterium]
MKATLLMFDPGVRSLFRTEMIVERTLFESTISEYATFGRRISNSGRCNFTRNDLVRPRSAKILETRRIDDDRTVMTVLTTEKSCDDEDIRVIRQYVAVRMNDRWYLFRPLGSLIQLMPLKPRHEHPANLELHADEPLRESAVSKTLTSPHRNRSTKKSSSWQKTNRLPRWKQKPSPHSPAIRFRDHASIRGDITSRRDFKKSVDSKPWASTRSSNNS